MPQGWEKRSRDLGMESSWRCKGHSPLALQAKVNVKPNAQKKKKLNAWSFLRDKHATGLEKDSIYIPGETSTFREHSLSACRVLAAVCIRSSQSLGAVPCFSRRNPEARWPKMVSVRTEASSDADHGRL